MPNVAVIPTPLARAAIAARNPGNASTCSIHEIAHRLGQAHRTPRYICTTIDLLIAEKHFPRAFPLARAGRLVATTHADSRFPRAAVDAWFDGQMPPGTSAAAERVEVDSRLSTNLRQLFAEDAA